MPVRKEVELTELEILVQLFTRLPVVSEGRSSAYFSDLNLALHCRSSPVISLD